MEILLSVIAVAMQLASTYLAYQYIVCRGEERCDFKTLLSFRYNKKLAIAFGCVFAVALLVFAKDFWLGDYNYVRALMNAEVFIWLALLGIVDLKEKIIPNKMIIIGLVFWCILVLLDVFVGGTPFIKVLVFSLAGGIGCGGLLLVISLIAKSALGMGDVKMFTVLGLLYGLSDAYSILLFSLVLMGVLCVGLLITKKANTKTTIPMAPFVAAGFLFGILAGM